MLSAPRDSAVHVLSNVNSNSFLKLLKPRAWGVCQRGMQTVDMRTRTEKVRTEKVRTEKKRSKKEECIKQACIRSILGVICYCCCSYE